MAPIKPEPELAVEKERFTQERVVILLNLIVGHVLENRAKFYKEPALLPVADHGGDRINKQIQNLLKGMVQSVAPGEPIVQDQLNKIKMSKGSSPKKRKTEE